MTPGTYLRLRREAAELTIADVVLLLLPESATTAEYRRTFADVEKIEVDEVIPAPIVAVALRRVFRFDIFVLRQLVARLDLAPEICRACGCSALDACDDEIAGACAWSSATHDLCTQCAGASAAASIEENRHA